MMRIDLEEEDFQLLMMLLGYATGTIERRKQQDGFPLSANRVLDLANKINANNPNWEPYKTENP